MGGSLTSGGLLSSNLESAQVNRLINSELNRGPRGDHIDIRPDLQSDTSRSASQYKDAVTAALAPIQSDPHVVASSPRTPSACRGPGPDSRDGHEALVIVRSTHGQKGWPIYNDLRAKVHSDALSRGPASWPSTGFNTTLESDLQRAETVTLPVTLILLIIIFASVIAAGLLWGVGILTIVGGIGTSSQPLQCLGTRSTSSP
jgi:hypothetical protein